MPFLLVILTKTIPKFVALSSLELEKARMKVSCAISVMPHLSSGTLGYSQSEGWEIDGGQGDTCLASSHCGSSLLAG